MSDKKILNLTLEAIKDVIPTDDKIVLGSHKIVVDTLKVVGEERKPYSKSITIYWREFEKE